MRERERDPERAREREMEQRIDLVLTSQGGKLADSGKEEEVLCSSTCKRITQLQYRRRPASNPGFTAEA